MKQRSSDFYANCKDTRYSHVTMCYNFGAEDCNLECWYAKQRLKQSPIEHFEVPDVQIELARRSGL